MNDSEEIRMKKPKIFIIKDHKHFFRLVKNESEAKEIAKALSSQNKREFFILTK